MTPRLWFGLFLRMLGAWIAYDALCYLISALSCKLNLYVPTASSYGSFLLRGLIELAAAWALLRFAPLLAAHYYPETRAER